MSIETQRTVVKQGTGSLAGNASVVLYESKDTDNRLHAPIRLSIWIAAAGTASVAIKFWNGTTYTTAKVTDSAATTTAKGGTASRLNIIQLDLIVPPFTEVLLSDTSTSTNAYEFMVFGVGL